MKKIVVDPKKNGVKYIRMFGNFILFICITTAFVVFGYANADKISSLLAFITISSALFTGLLTYIMCIGFATIVDNAAHQKAYLIDKALTEEITFIVNEKD